MNALTPWNIECTGSQCGDSLRHSWLRNQVLNKSDDDILFLRQSGPWRALDLEFPLRVQETLRLSCVIADAFSPTQLFEREPLVCLPVECRDMLLTAVQEAYLEGFLAGEVRDNLRTAASKLSKSLSAMSSVWHDLSDPPGTKLLAAWRCVKCDAETLLAELEKLPRGVVLP